MRTEVGVADRLSAMTESSSSPRRIPTRRPSGRGGQGRGGSGRGTSTPLVELAAIETPPELILFNAYLSAEKDVERERQRIRQAEVAKDKAAAQLKDAQSGGSREDIAAAEAEYRQRVEEWKRIRDGEEIAAADEVAAEVDAAEDAAEADAEVADGESPVDTPDDASEGTTEEDAAVDADGPQDGANPDAGAAEGEPTAGGEVNTGEAEAPATEAPAPEVTDASADEAPVVDEEPDAQAPADAADVSPGHEPAQDESAG